MMWWELTLLTCFCEVLGQVTVQEEFTPMCYDCKSEEWNITDDCEDPTTPFGDNPRIPKAEKCAYCYIIYGKGDDFLVRTCMSEAEFNKSKYKNETKYKVVTSCNDDNLCNRTPVVWDELDTFQETEHTLNEEDKPCISLSDYHVMFKRIEQHLRKTDAASSVLDKDKTCYRCLSVGSKHCNTIENSTKISRKGKCQNRICVTIHNKKLRALKRDCYSWKKVKKLIEEGDKDWTIDWCRNENCNTKKLSDFPGCKGGASKHLVRTGGCIVVKDWKKGRAEKVTISGLTIALTFASVFFIYKKTF